MFFSPYFTLRFNWLLAFAGFDLPTRLPEGFFPLCSARAFQANGLWLREAFDFCMTACLWFNITEKLRSATCKKCISGNEASHKVKIYSQNLCR